MMQNQYCHMMDQTAPGEDLIQAAVQQSTAARRCRRRKRPRLAAAVAAAVLAAVIMAMPVMAAVEPFREVLYAVSPATAQYFTPVPRACVSNGIRMEVAACFVHDDTAELYVTLQDLEGDRVDETTDLFDSYTIRQPYDTAATCSLVHYDAPTGTAVFQIQITQWGGHRIEGSKITFQVQEFLSHKTVYDDVEIPLSMSSLDQAQTQTVGNITGCSGAAVSEDVVSVLCPGAPMKEFPVRGIHVTAAGYVDGQLHVQTAVRDALQNDNHGFLQLQGREGERLEALYTVSFCNQWESEGRVDYQEFVFDVPEAEIGQYQLIGAFTTSGMRTEGSWSVTFPMTNMEAQSLETTSPMRKIH